jgi:hypothetical protein
MEQKQYSFSQLFKNDVVKVGNVFGANGKWNLIVNIRSVANFGNYTRIEGKARQILDPYTQGKTIIHTLDK